MSRATLLGLVAWFVMLAGGGAAIGAVFSHPLAGFAIGAGIFVLIMLFFLAMGALFFGGIIYLFESLSGKRQRP